MFKVGEIARSAAPSRTRMAMPAHLEAMIGAPARRERVKPAVSIVERPVDVTEARLKAEAEYHREQMRDYLARVKKKKIERMFRDAQRYGCVLKSLDAGRFRRGQMSFIIEQFAKMNRLEIDYLKSEKRYKEIVKPRQRLFWILSINGPFATTEIGRAFDRDHSTVVHGIQMVKKDAEQLELAKMELKYICQMFDGGESD
jgi:chromosomal replication initiation ATPase DnaA